MWSGRWIWQSQAEATIASRKLRHMPWFINLLYATLLLVVSPWLVFRALTTNRYREGWCQKLFGQVPRGGRSQQTIWLHGVSVGEIQLLKPLLHQLRKDYPDAQFMVSTTTRTGMELAQKTLAEEQVFYFPLDFSWSVRRALSRIRPSLIVLGELELWPNFIHFAQQRDIPIVVVNARLSERSFRGYQRFSWLMRPMFARLSLVAAQDISYAQRFQACGTPADRLVVTGSVKFDNVTFDRHCEQVEQLRALVGLSSVPSMHEANSPIVWIVGSTQPPEEIVAAQAFMRLSETYPTLRLILVPRHPERFDAVFRELKSLGLNPHRRSNIQQPIASDQWRVLLVDTVGELRWWWGIANLALVGGSFGSRGGQNMLEPAAYGTNVGFGPNTSNFRDISQLLLAHDAAVRVQGLEEIQPWLQNQLENPQVGQERGARAQALVRSHQGALQRTCTAIGELLHARRS
jgi:3-deoxy-D-manno-octulosonic-acid transferase